LNYSPDNGCLEFNLQVAAGEGRKLKLELYTLGNGCLAFNLQVAAGEGHKLKLELKTPEIAHAT
jgi:hypothetical protein